LNEKHEMMAKKIGGSDFFCNFVEILHNKHHLNFQPIKHYKAT